MLNNLTPDDRILIVSPHLDDAVLSAGGTMDLAIRRGCAVVAATLITADVPADAAASPLVKELHDWWGLGQNPYVVRREEDVAAVGLLGASYLHGGILDSIYRKRADGQVLYATRKAVFSPPAGDDPARESFGALLTQWVKTFRPTIILCPMTVGRHVDHMLTLEAAMREARGWDAPVYLYEDMPYSAGFFPPDHPDSVFKAREREVWRTTEYVDVPVDFAAKYASILKYASQIAEIFPGLNPEIELRRYMTAGEGKGYRERFWLAGNNEEHQL